MYEMEIDVTVNYSLLDQLVQWWVSNQMLFDFVQEIHEEILIRNLV